MRENRKKNRSSLHSATPDFLLIGGVGELHAAFLTESRTRGRFQSGGQGEIRVTLAGNEEFPYCLEGLEPSNALGAKYLGFRALSWMLGVTVLKNASQMVKIIADGKRFWQGEVTA